ncbi:MAG: hypothetical protein U5K99_10530 [Anaerolineales bacterium]|nr:hypothetical protein [Anaerolineales bacterium]
MQRVRVRVCIKIEPDQMLQVQEGKQCIETVFPDSDGSIMILKFIGTLFDVSRKILGEPHRL